MGDNEIVMGTDGKVYWVHLSVDPLETQRKVYEAQARLLSKIQSLF
jgi:hypothetical protein